MAQSRYRDVLSKFQFSTQNSLGSYFQFLFAIIVKWIIKTGVSRSVTYSYLSISLVDLQVFAHIYQVWYQLIFFAVDYWESMNWDQDFITFTMNSYAIIVVFVFVIRCELDIDFFCNPRGNHTFLIVSDFEVGSGRRKDM